MSSQQTCETHYMETIQPPRPHAKEHKHKEQLASRPAWIISSWGRDGLASHYCFGSWQVLGQVRQFFVSVVVI